MKIYIKNMVCDRCIMAVKTIMENLGIDSHSIMLGEVELGNENLNKETLNQLDMSLESLGFERIDDKRSRLIEKIKGFIIQSVHHAKDINQAYKWSAIISSEFNYDYKYLSNLFSSVTGITIEQFIIRQKVERIKELIRYDELTLSEIAWNLGYSSVAHLSSQFKSITGLSPSMFKAEIAEKRKPLDKV